MRQKIEEIPKAYNEQILERNRLKLMLLAEACYLAHSILIASY